MKQGCLISHYEEHYEKIEDELLALKAIQAEKEGWLDQDESADFLAQLGSAGDCNSSGGYNLSKPIRIED